MLPTRSWALTRSGAATCSVPREWGASSPIHGSPTSRCPLPTQIRPRRDCESAAASPKRIVRQWKNICARVDLPKAIAGVRAEAAKIGGPRQAFLTGTADSLDVMLDLAMEVAGKGDPVPYARCVEASTAKPPEPSSPEAKRERVAELLGRAGYSPSNGGGLLEAVDAWRRERVTPMASVRALGAAVIAHFDNLSAKNLLPHLPRSWCACLAQISISWLSRMPGSPVR